MAVETFTTPRSNLPNEYIDVIAREVDFVTRFNQNWESLRNIMGISRPVKKEPGTQLISYETTVELASGEVPAGAVIPYSKHTTKEVRRGDVTVEKYAHAVTIEDVEKYGPVVAIEKGDDEFKNELQGVVLTRFYDFLNTGSLTGTESTWQRALAMAKGKVVDKFQKMRKPVTEVVGFANILDLYDWLGDREITIQNMFGLSYIQNFLGYRTLFLLSEPDIAQGTVIAVPVENIVLYYTDPSDPAYAKMGLRYTTEGETNLIGFHVQGNYSTAVGETFALMGMTLWAEYLDGIAVMTVAGG